jgi:hypothetical protein
MPPSLAFTIINTINMSLRYKTPIDLSDNTFDLRGASSAPLSTGLPNAFGRIIAALVIATVTSEHKAPTRQRDTCRRPKPTYNNKYNPFIAPPADLDPRYSLYTNREPLYNDRPIITTRLP